MTSIQKQIQLNIATRIKEEEKEVSRSLKSVHLTGKYSDDSVSDGDESIVTYDEANAYLAPQMFDNFDQFLGGNRDEMSTKEFAESYVDSIKEAAQETDLNNDGSLNNSENEILPDNSLSEGRFRLAELMLNPSFTSVLPLEEFKNKLENTLQDYPELNNLFVVDQEGINHPYLDSLKTQFDFKVLSSTEFNLSDTIKSGIIESYGNALNIDDLEVSEKFFMDADQAITWVQSFLSEKLWQTAMTDNGQTYDHNDVAVVSNMMSQISKDIAAQFSEMEKVEVYFSEHSDSSVASVSIVGKPAGSDVWQILSLNMAEYI